MKMLWHGSGSVEPEKIYDGLEAFDICYSKTGLWGKGIYFAQQASYSLDFAH